MELLLVGPPAIQSALIGVAASPTVKRFAYPLTYHRQFDTMQSGLAWRDGMQFDKLKRREFITLLGGAAAWPLAARAQQPAMPVIGVLHGVSAAQWTDRMAGFHRGLGEAGLAEGRNVSIDYRWAEGQFDRLPAMAADLVSRKVAVISAGAPDVAVRAAMAATMAATKTIPIVFVTASDPVGAGFVPSLGRPGGNVTGITLIGTELVAKRLELLHELLPDATRIAILVNPNNPGLTRDNIQQSEAAVRRLGLEMVVIKAGTESEIESAVVAAVQQHANALSMGNDAYLSSRSRQIAFFALRHGLATMSDTRETVAAGLLMSYGPNLVDSFRQAGLYVGRIIKGEKSADLPVLQPTKFELVINLTTAKAIGLKIPESFLLRADEVME
jgi:putative ABC transport system substrate-binding protein